MFWEHITIKFDQKLNRIRLDSDHAGLVLITSTYSLAQASSITLLRQLFSFGGKIHQWSSIDMSLRLFCIDCHGAAIG